MFFISCSINITISLSSISLGQPLYVMQDWRLSFTTLMRGSIDIPLLFEDLRDKIRDEDLRYRTTVRDAIQYIDVIEKIGCDKNV